jgi:ABC-2 type transport system ATP-binding protein
MYALNISGLSKTYHNGVKALQGIEIQVAAGDFFALLGPNGAGKSTMIGILTSLVNKTEGNVKIFDYDIDQNALSAKACIGVVPQEFNMNIFDTCKNTLFYQAGYYGISPGVAREQVDYFLHKLGLWKKRFTIVNSLSGGMKRRLMIARALIHQPRMLILDEPTAGIDIETRRSMWQFLTELNEQGMTIILTTHYLEEAENLCRHIAIIDKGQIIAHASMTSFLRKLNKERFILYLSEPYKELPKIEGFTLAPIDQRTIEVEIYSHQNLNDLFVELNKKNMLVSSMRNKTNRLEELFLELTMTKEEL